MAVKYCSLVSKGSLGQKHSKRYPILAVLSLTMISSIYICLLPLNQKGFKINPNAMRVEFIEEPYGYLNFPTFEFPHVHYPKPTTYSRNECECIPVRYFAIITMQRSGSGWFETLLNSHINISSNGEIFSVKERRSNMSTITETLDKVYNLDWHSSASKNECTGAVGFKWMLNQGDDPLPQTQNQETQSLEDQRVRARRLGESWGLMQNQEDIVEYFKRRGISSVFLFRRNLLRRWVSLLANAHDRDAKQLNGTHKAHVHSRHEAEVLARFKPVIDVERLIPDMIQAAKWSSDILRSFLDTHHIVLFYEDLVRNRTKMMDILSFLKMPPRKLTSRHVKIHTKLLLDHIENWGVVARALNGTQYENFSRSDYRKK